MATRARRRGTAADPTGRAYERLARHRFGWLVETLVEEPSFVLKPMFGCLACYLHGRLMLILADRRPPWRGVLVPTERDMQPDLRREFPALAPHAVLPKWLHLPDGAEHFEQIGTALVERALAGDPRLGVEPKPRASRRRAKPTSARARRPTGSR